MKALISSLSFSVIMIVLAVLLGSLPRFGAVYGGSAAALLILFYAFLFSSGRFRWGLIAIGMAVLALALGSTPEFGALAGGPVGPGIAVAGFALLFGTTIAGKVIVWTIIVLGFAILTLILTLLMAVVPGFGQVPGAPIGIGFAAGGFAMAYGLSLRDRAVFWIYLPLVLSWVAAVVAFFMGVFPEMGRVPGAAAGMGAISAGFAIAYGPSFRDRANFWTYFSLGLSLTMTLFTILMGAIPKFGQVEGGATGAGIAAAGLAVAFILAKNPSNLFWPIMTLISAVIMAVLTICMAAIPDFGQVPGAPVGIGAAASGMAIAHGFSLRERPPRLWAAISLVLALAVAVVAILMGSLSDIGKVPGAPVGVGVVAAGFAIAYGRCVGPLPRVWAYISLGISFIMALLAFLMRAISSFGEVTGAEAGLGVMGIGFAFAYVLALRSR